MQNVDADEQAQFSALAAQWWELDGPMAPLHDLNPLRFDYVCEFANPQQDTRILDIGCGGGLLTESLADISAHVEGLDASADLIEVARQHAIFGHRKIDYHHTSAEEFATRHSAGFDIVTCMELIEHVPDPQSLVRACADLTASGGWIFFSTINRTLAAYLGAITLAEYLLRLLPRGTHDYAKFLKPAELVAMGREAGLSVTDISGMSYHPYRRRARRVTEVGVNYLVALRKS
ncbi:MAG: bifunctional 2-polyprenyl-6-hydroxyphenol methylase/3-demethylubiquinol 3-O-methyltransferase UbiG [Pseudomonadota bacterium]